MDLDLDSIFPQEMVTSLAVDRFAKDYPAAGRSAADTLPLDALSPNTLLLFIPLMNCPTRMTELSNEDNEPPFVTPCNILIK